MGRCSCLGRGAWRGQGSPGLRLPLGQSPVLPGPVLPPQRSPLGEMVGTLCSPPQGHRSPLPRVGCSDPTRHLCRMGWDSLQLPTASPWGKRVRGLHVSLLLPPLASPAALSQALQGQARHTTAPSQKKKFILK